MADVLTKEQRHKNMKNIRGTDTKIEIILRKALWAKGYRYRKNYSKLPGKPDIVLTKYKIAIFCDGEFFHGKDWEVLKPRLEKSNNSEFWISKISRNRERDDEEREQSVREKLEEFSQAELVITDRLHGMIFSAITSTPCIAMDNLSRKVSGGYEWLKYLEYIQMVEPETISMDSVKKMLDYNGKGYSRQPLEQYYGKIKHSIRLEEA